MKNEELKQKTQEELTYLLDNSRRKLKDLRFDLKSGKVKNVRIILDVKKEIARIQTILKQR